jgi:hypothetical protein
MAKIIRKMCNFAERCKELLLYKVNDLKKGLYEKSIENCGHCRCGDILVAADIASYA